MSPDTNTLKLHIDRMKDQQLEQAIETNNEDPTTVAVVTVFFTLFTGPAFSLVITNA